MFPQVVFNQVETILLQRVNLLCQLAVHGLEIGAQGFMACHNAVQCASQRDCDSNPALRNRICTEGFCVAPEKKLATLSFRDGLSGAAGAGGTEAVEAVVAGAPVPPLHPASKANASSAPTGERWWPLPDLGIARCVPRVIANSRSPIAYSEIPAPCPRRHPSRRAAWLRRMIAPSNRRRRSPARRADDPAKCHLCTDIRGHSPPAGTRFSPEA